MKRLLPKMLRKVKSITISIIRKSLTVFIVLALMLALMLAIIVVGVGKMFLFVEQVLSRIIEKLGDILFKR